MLFSKSLKVMAGIALVAGLSLAMPASAEQLIVDIVGIKRLGGSLMVAVFDSADAWENTESAVAKAKESVSGPKVRLVFSDLAPGSYAVKLYHDENSNGILDKNMLGIPSEGYGFSNNLKSLGEPSFENSQFVIDGSTTIEVTLN